MFYSVLFIMVVESLYILIRQIVSFFHQYNIIRTPRAETIHMHAATCVHFETSKNDHMQVWIGTDPRFWEHPSCTVNTEDPAESRMHRPIF